MPGQGVIGKQRNEKKNNIKTCVSVRISYEVEDLSEMPCAMQRTAPVLFLTSLLNPQQTLITSPDLKVDVAMTSENLNPTHITEASDETE